MLCCKLVMSVDIVSVGGNAPHAVNNVLMGDAAERFGMREAQKLHFLGE